MTRLGRTWPAALGAVALTSVGAARDAHALDGPSDTQAAPCRPTIACTADFAAPGAVELEAGGIYRHLGGGLGQVTTPFLVKVTTTKWLQLQVGSNGYTHETGPGAASFFDNMNLGAKFHLVDQEGLRPSVAVAFAVSVPSGSQAQVTPTDSLLLTAFVSKDFGPLHADFNAGLDRLGVNDDPSTQAWLSLALSTSLPAHLGVELESYYFSPALPIANHDGGVLGALTYNPLPWLVLDAGGDVGYFATRSFSLFGGLTVIPFVLWKAP